MREIKFRAWSEEIKEMRYLDCEEDANYGHIICGNGALFTDVMQFTGLHDKNGKEIYEGDIVKNHADILVIEWNNNFSSFCLMRKGWMFSHFFGEAFNGDECEVIGNIHENPELIK